jgi:signal transduction histidine kinase/CheY-like chemotaxis protein
MSPGASWAERSLKVSSTPPSPKDSIGARLRNGFADIFALAPSIGLTSIFPALWGSFAIFSVVAAVSTATFYNSQLDWVRHTEEVRGGLARTFSTVQDAELGYRGYLLTHDQIYIELIEAQAAATDPELAALSALIADDAAQQASLTNLRAMITRQFDANRKSLSGAGAGELSRPVIPLAEIRDAVRAMERREDDLLRQRTENASRTLTWLLWLGAVPLGLVGAGLLLWRRDRQAALAAQASRNSETKAAQSSLETANSATVTAGLARDTAEAQVRQMQKMEAIGQLTGGIAHDFNNMNAVVMSAISLCRRRLARGETDIGSLLDAAIDAAQRSAALTARLLAFSRQQQLVPQVLDPSRFISGMTELLRRTLGENIVIETVLGGGLWRTSADPSQLENVILNLCVNARDAMPQGGRLTLETANVSLDDVYARANVDVAAGQYVMIAVTDNGEGMSPEVIGRAFEPFYTTKPLGEGTGLGLSQVFGFVKQSGGHVKIYSEPGKGTTIKIYLPRYTGDKTIAPAAEPHPLVPRGNVGEIVLVVEDERRLREVTVAGLRELGYTIIHAEDGASALHKIDEHPEISCLFTDIIMPGMTGRQLADEATRRRPDLKVLFTTGYARESVIHNQSLAQGVNFLPKPYTLDDLALKMRAVLEGQASAPAV